MTSIEITVKSPMDGNVTVEVDDELTRTIGGPTEGEIIVELMTKAVYQVLGAYGLPKELK